MGTRHEQTGGDALNVRRLLHRVAELLGFIVVSMWLWQHVLLHPSTERVRGGQLDPGLFIWWLRSDAFAVVHHHNPLYSSYLDAPTGVSAMWNTSVVALGCLFAPLTELFGAVFTFNVLAILAPALSAWTCSLWLRRHAGGASLFGGLLFGFSPFVLIEDGGHLDLACLFLLPVIAMLVEDVCWRKARPWRASGPLLGLMAAIQLLISSEILVIMAMGTAVAVGLVAVSHPRQITDHLRPAALGFAVAIVIGAALMAVPLISQFSAGHAIKGTIQPIDYYEGQPVDLIAAPSVVMLHTARSARVANQLTAENGLYMGLPLLATVVGVLIALGRRRKAVLVAGISALMFLVLSMGGRLRNPSGRGYHGPTLPWGYLEGHAHVLRNVLPVRFAIPMWLAVAFLAAVGLDAATARYKGRAIVVVAAVAVACLIPLVPISKPGGIRVVTTPRFFVSRDLRAIPRNSIVLLAPIPDVYFDAGMFWQGRSDMWFAQVGGYSHHPVGPDRHNRDFGGPPTLNALLSVGPNGSTFRGALSPVLKRRALTELRRSSATAVLVGQSRYSPEMVSTVTQLLNRAPDVDSDGAALWYLRR